MAQAIETANRKAAKSWSVLSAFRAYPSCQAIVTAFQTAIQAATLVAMVVFDTFSKPVAKTLGRSQKCLNYQKYNV